MLIQQKKLKHWIDNFYGYGSWQSKLWFIGYEEGGGELPEEVAEKLNYFYKAHPPGNEKTLCDLRELYQQVTMRWEGPKASSYNTLYEYRFDTRATLHGSWKNLIAFAHGYRNKKVPNLLTYQKNSFASISKNQEALIQLYPLPSPHNHAWYYSWVDLPGLEFIRNRSLYQEHVYQSRINTILSNINTFKPELVLMYGMDNINGLKNSVQEFFEGTKFKMVKAIKQQIPQHHRADFNGTTLLITTQIPTLRHNRIETGFDWEGFGKMARDGD